MEGNLMSELYDTKRYTLTEKDGVIIKDTTFGNFCPKCNAPSDRCMVYGRGLFVCSDCDQVFTVDQWMKNMGIDIETDYNRKSNTPILNVLESMYDLLIDTRRES